ncbi:MAG TPA: MaoC family dehydratase [Bacillota bacterium]|nr:MaoC family dehydratase [Bacillota bacterium]
MQKELTYDDIKIGDRARFRKTIAEHDVYSFAGITGDFNPMHLDEEYAKSTFFKGRIAHGMLTGSFISTVLGMKLPGPNTIYLSQTLKFLAPVRIGETIQAEVEVLEKDDAKRQIRLKTTVTRPDGKVVVDGEALVMKKDSL